jgi:hypothetical protein
VEREDHTGTDALPDFAMGGRDFVGHSLKRRWAIFKANKNVSWNLMKTSGSPDLVEKKEDISSCSKNATSAAF